METTQLTKYIARQAFYTYEFANMELGGRDINYLEQQTAVYNEKYDNITTKNGAFIYVRYHQGIRYEYIIDCHKMCLHPVVEIDGQRYTIDDIKEFLGDLTPEQQKQALQRVPIRTFEKYIEKRTGYPIKFEIPKIYQNKDTYTLDLCTGNLIEQSGICKAMLKEIHIEMNGIGFYIDNETGEQRLWLPSIHFKYTHMDNATNGHEMGRIRYVNGRYQGYNYETETWENI